MRRRYVREVQLSSRAGAVFAVPRASYAASLAWAMTDNSGVLRQLMDRPDWPLISGLALATLATAESILYSGFVSESDDSMAVVLNLLATAPLAARRTHLAAVATTVTVATLWLLASELQPTVAGFAGQAWVLYLVAARAPRWVTAALGVVFLICGVAPIGGGDGALESAILLLLAVAALAIGASHKLTAERDAARREQAAMGERARIARELHDVVAHHISMIVVEADTARLATPGMPEAGQERLLSIRATARTAMDEMRRLLGVLRDDAGAAVEHAPQPGLERVNELLDAAREAGTPVRLKTHGPVGPLAAGVDLAAYRIVQEALTNARRHAPGAAVEVELGYADDRLRVRVRDDGPGPAGGASGHGLAGMRERAAAVGGSLRAGAAAGGGFEVEADLPR